MSWDTGHHMLIEVAYRSTSIVVFPKLAWLSGTFLISSLNLYLWVIPSGDARHSFSPILRSQEDLLAKVGTVDDPTDSILAFVHRTLASQTDSAVFRIRPASELFSPLPQAWKGKDWKEPSKTWHVDLSPTPLEFQDPPWINGDLSDTVWRRAKSARWEQSCCVVPRDPKLSETFVKSVLFLCAAEQGHISALLGDDAVG